MKEEILKGVNNIISLCDECKEIIESTGEINYRVIDILAEDIPELSESLFKVILNVDRVSKSN